MCAAYQVRPVFIRLRASLSSVEVGVASPDEVARQVKKLYGDEYVKNRRGIFEYVLGGCEKTQLLDIRFFEDSLKRVAYERQTTAAKEKVISNCSYCAIGHESNQSKIWQLSEMDADHVSAWSKGGATTADNCEMLCKPHNRAKGNR
jgi:5-methylcytosine-specific restriction endonuclease McrA